MVLCIYAEAFIIIVNEKVKLVASFCVFVFSIFLKICSTIDNIGARMFLYFQILPTFFFKFVQLMLMCTCNFKETMIYIPDIY